MAFKSYFDGGNKADHSQYETLSLAVVSGTGIHWDDFERRWTEVLCRHDVPWLHTADALSPNGELRRRKGWSMARVNDFLGDCVTVIEKCAAQRRNRTITYAGLRPATITVVLKDYQRAVDEIPNLGAVEQLLAVQAAVCAMTYGRASGFPKFQFFFDQGEPFYGHIRDRINNKQSKKSSPDWKSIIQTSEADMRSVPALQAADVIAWSVNHQHNVA